MTRASGLWAMSILGGCMQGSGAGSHTAALNADCSGTYECYLDGEWTSEEDVSSDGTSCTVDIFVLDPGGAVSVPSEPDYDGFLTWTGDASEFAICNEDATSCVTCLRAEDDAIEADPGPSCQGSPTSCSSQSPGSCSAVRGCYLHTNWHYGGGYDESCSGSPHSCSSMYSQGSCEEQGCYWE